jgi:dihydroceramidase
MTGTGAYYYIVWGIWLRHHLNYRQNEYELLWPNLWTVPEVVKQGSSGQNGSTKGEKKEL